MAQVIRKYKYGGNAGLTWVEADNPNIEFFGDTYTRSELSDQVFGKDYIQYKLQLDLSDLDNSNLDTIMHNYVDGLLSGRLVMQNDKIVDSLGQYQNDGIIKKGKNLTPDEIQNNLSIFAANYLVDRFNRKRPFKTSPKLDSYVFDVEKALWDGTSGGFNIESFIYLDSEKDPKTGLRSTKNRAKKLSDVLRKELRNLYENVEYRNSFNWGGKDFEQSLRYAKKTADTLGLLAKGLSDGKVDEEDIGYIKSLGLDAPFEELLGILTKESAEIKRKLEEAAKLELQQIQQQAQLAEDLRNYLAGVYSNGFLFSKYPWETPTFVYNGKIYEYPYAEDAGASKLANDYIADWKNIYSIKNTDLDFLANLAYDDTSKVNYVADLSTSIDFGDNPIQNVYILKKDFHGGYKVAVLDTDGNYHLGNKLLVNSDNTIGAYLDYNNKMQWMNLGYYLPAENETFLVYKPLLHDFSEFNYNSPELFMNSLQSFINTYDTNLLVKLYSRIINHILKNINKQVNNKTVITRGGENNNMIYVGMKNRPGFVMELTDAGRLKDNASLNIYDIRGISVTPNLRYKKGGILKGFNGVDLVRNGATPTVPKKYQKLQQNVEQEKSKIVLPNASFSSDDNEYNQWITGQEITGTDKTRLGAALADLTSALAGFVPGLNVASAVVGAGSSLAEYGSDLYDWISGREGAQGFWSSTGELAMNLGMDAVSLIPAGKSAKLAKSLKVISSWAPHVMGIALAYNMFSNDLEREAFMKSWLKLNKLLLSSLDTRDLHNITFGLRTLLGGKNAIKQFTPTKSTFSTISGEVKLKDGTTRPITATVKNSDLKTWSSNKKTATLALVKAANDDSELVKLNSDDGSSDVKKFTTDDVEVKTGLFGVKASLSKIKESGTYTPKKAFEGWFGSNGFNWKFSDYGLSLNQKFKFKVLNLEEKQNEFNRIAELDRIKFILKKIQNPKYIYNLIGKKIKNKELLAEDIYILSIIKPDVVNNKKTITKRDIEKYRSDIDAAKGTLTLELRKSLLNLKKYIKKNKIKSNKEGGLLIRKLLTGGTAEELSLYDQVPYFPYTFTNDEGGLFLNDTFDNIYDIVQLLYTDPDGNIADSHTAEDAKSWVYDLLGRDNSARSGRLPYHTETNDNNKNTNNLTLSNSENLLRKYKKNGLFKKDVKDVYNKWKDSNPNGSVNDFLLEYNNDLKDLYVWTHIKSSPTYAKDTYGYDLQISKNDPNTIGTWNALFLKLYPTLDTYDSGLFPIHGLSSVIRFPLYFDELDGELKEKANRTVELDGKRIYFDAKGFLVPEDEEIYWEETEDTDDESNEESDESNETNIYTAINPKEVPSTFDPNYGLFGDLTNLGIAIAGNANQLNNLRKLKPVFKDPVYKYNVVRGSIFPLLYALRLAASALTAARLPISANSAVQLGSILDTVFKGDEHINKYTDDNITAYNSSLLNDLNTRNDNLKSEVDTANANHLAAISMHNTLIGYKNTSDAAITKSFQDFVTAITSDAKLTAIHKTAIKQKLIELQYKQSITNAYTKFNSEIMSKIKEDKKFISDYRTKMNYPEDLTISDAELKSAYFEVHPELKSIWEKAWQAIEAKIAIDHYNNASDLYKYSWNMVNPGFTYDVTTGNKLDNKGNLTDIPVQMKKGGTMTTKDKLKLQSLKDYNKARREDTKEFNKNMRESQKEFNKMLKELSKTSLTLLKTAMQIS